MCTCVIAREIEKHVFVCVFMSGRPSLADGYYRLMLVLSTQSNNFTTQEQKTITSSATFPLGPHFLTNLSSPS